MPAQRDVHPKFPFAVVGGVLVIPTYEETGTRAAAEADKAQAAELGDEAEPEPVPGEEGATPEARPGLQPGQRSTRHLIARAVQRLICAGGRKAEAAHLLEGIAAIAYDPG